MGIPQSIYVIETTKNRIKIGITSKIDVRFRTIECQCGREITKSFVTDKCNDAYKVESLLHRRYKDNRAVGEWFDIGFNTAVEYLKTIQLDTNIKEDDGGPSKLSELPIHTAGWAVIMAFSKPCNEYTYSNLVDSITDAMDMFRKYTDKDNDSPYEEDPLLQFEIMRANHNMRVKRLLENIKRIGI